MRHIGTVVGTGVLLLVISACGSAQNAGAGAGGGQELPTATSTSEVPPNVAPGEVPPDGKPVTKLDANALPPDQPRTAWTQGDGKTVGVVAQEGGCGKASASVLEQNASTVKIELLETLPLTKEMCTMDIRFPPLTVQLSEPLGERTVVLTSRQEQK
ncbi:hypothetical protein [Lentzea albidocapillata]|uniref:META domain-containing protein n=1 Tax=Lentzea albidocapillata TaxID=40571 RepID=A0A1W2EWD1_9PSEU|nr:hypothetical protein [Lentzea albidocapillata]SMD13995.1 hypothetical protein SAMN05660733_04602 [Lentzea albidocapillata]